MPYGPISHVMSPCRVELKLLLLLLLRIIISSGGVKALDIFVRNGDNRAFIRNRRHSNRRAAKSLSTLARPYLSLLGGDIGNNDDVGYQVDDGDAGGDDDDDDDGTTDTRFNSPAEK